MSRLTFFFLLDSILFEKNKQFHDFFLTSSLLASLVIGLKSSRHVPNQQWKQKNQIVLNIAELNWR